MSGTHPAPVSVRTLHIAGILVDIYGVDELPPDVQAVTVLWLHHPRLRARDDMAAMAAQAVHAAARPVPRAGLIAAAFDQRNHGSRAASDPANDAWREGNPRHAQDMFGLVRGTVVDTSLLIDLLGAYAEDLFAGLTAPDSVCIAAHMVLGVSLGGHSAWQLMFDDPRVSAAVVVIGCPDYIALMCDRARLSRRPSFARPGSEPGFRSFLGSSDFPNALIHDVCAHDPKGRLFGTAELPPSQQPANTDPAVEKKLVALVRGKRFLLCSGAVDKLVPYAVGKPFVDAFKYYADTLPALQLIVQDRIYDGVGHAFTPAMKDDAVAFLLRSIELQLAGEPESGATTSKI
ncbi:hypothetical protein CMQ_6473 [Grosmannia clavigera kw1407]|uniref:AB hydrolase-1 domain-containing protein n=1 Tax=Grosmannia clavigera (strain kw1407 / UAMH 11150) TaxID=655863 RepID=F0XLN5_GROCL|nr:uncharacterized protein CMQ_6473 [Grosmannia clavigera kw1407]EFX01531.1 hypothetical protein CMQ_6473 [Grosmannia clavigera kw1407]